MVFTGGGSFIGLMAVNVLTAVLMNSSLLECFTCQMIKRSLCFRAAYCSHLQGLCICNLMLTDM